MRKPVFITGEEAAAMIADNATVATIGMTLVSAAETILKAIEQRFLETGSPRGLTLVHSCGQSDRDRGIQHFAHETMLSRIIGGHWALQEFPPASSQLPQLSSPALQPWKQRPLLLLSVYAAGN